MIKKSIAIVGGAGSLGTAILKLMKKTRWITVNVDYKESPLASTNILLKKDVPLSAQIPKIHATLTAMEEEYDAMISTAGDMPGKSSIKDPSFFTAYQEMYKTNVESAILCIIG